MSRSVSCTQQKKLGYKGAAMYIHAYKLNFEYNLKNIKLLHFARQLRVRVDSRPCSLLE